MYVVVYLKHYSTSTSVMFSSSPLTRQLQEVSSSFHPISLLLGLVVVLVSMAKVKHYMFKSRNIHNLPPGPKPWPIVGNLPEMLIYTMIKKQPAYKWIHALMNHLQTDISCIRLGGVHVITVRSPEIALEFLKEHDSVFSSRPKTMSTGITSSGFLSTVVAPEGEQWKKMRRLVSGHMINPAMKLQWLREKRDQEADNLVRFLYNQCKSNGGVVNVRVAASQFFGNVLRRMLFDQRYFGRGREDGGPGFEEEEHIEAALKVIGHVYSLSPSDYNVIFRMLDLDGHGKIVKEGMKSLTKYQDVIIDERVKQWRDGNKTDEAQDLLDLLILARDSSGQQISVQEIKAQCAELSFGTVHIASNTVEWAMAEIINQPNILHKAVEEIDKVVGKERRVQESDLPSLLYLKACVRESFRLHPISPFLPPHVSTADAVVSNYFIPKGSEIMVSRIDLGRNPRVWPEPLRFNPDRHSKDADNARVEINEQELKFISFGRGRRGCTAAALGSSMMLMFLANLLQGFSWKLPPTKKKIDVTTLRNGVLFLDEPLHALVDLRLDQAAYIR